ncbi:HAD-IC family P-type ATPase [Geomonas sp. Red32]|uniref:cation-translocating P-type ATPase n=1 Tax=Geomonas sp. Red32 TaxID=2912856 RepID=UPI00202CE7E8|nr:HAD-IC family P-type ATPase [Geomonas sp. Red32]MCM0081618.1 HAD-IC family P-type ATPase [Geomonas sp. Red32]
MASLRPDPSSPWHALPLDAVYSTAGSSAAGLTDDEARSRLSLHGPNILAPPRPVSPLGLLAAQFKNVLIAILLIACLLSLFLGHTVEAITIGVIVFFAALLGFVQEYRAGRAIEALRKLAAPSALVVRCGTERELPVAELVPGDLVVLRAGDRVPADLRLVESFNLRAEESVLTGESASVDKFVFPLEEGASLAERVNMAYAGTIISYGRGRGLVVATGMATEFGAIAGMLAGIEAGRTPLQENLDRVGALLARAAVAGVVVIALLGILRGEPLMKMVIFGIALAVAVVPEALPAVVTISLALGVQRMVRRHALMRRLAAVETLGATTVICSDKTGTLTRDEMTVRRIWVGGTTVDVSGIGYAPEGGFGVGGRKVELFPALARLLEAAVLASDAECRFDPVQKSWVAWGDPTEAALVAAAAKGGVDKPALATAWPRVDEIPFSSESKRMTTLHEGGVGLFACAKGAAEVILAGCNRILSGAGERPLDAEERVRVLDTANAMASVGLRVLAVASKSATNRIEAERGMLFLGLAGINDPPRPEAVGAVATCRRAAIRPVMITGDHPVTAAAVARELGILAEGRVVTGKELAAMDDAQLEREVEGIDVFARVSPADKLRVVTALQKKGEVVAMTGDGVNDAPALKKADIGIAMGIGGTEVSREAAAMTLTDDNFASIVAAVEEGRGIFDNIKKYLMYLLSSNTGEILLVAVTQLLGLPLPLSAVQLLYVNLATDGLPALALAVDPADPGLMRRPPRKAAGGIFTRPVTFLILLGGIWSTVANLFLFLWARWSGRSLAEAMMVTFVSLVLIQLVKAYNFRSDRHSVLRRPFANRWLNAAVVWEFLLLLVVIYLPALREAFGSYPLSLADWGMIVLTAVSVAPVLELGKYFVRRSTPSSP